MAGHAIRYEKILTLASGGMGRVDLALRRDEGFERIYAIKRLHSHFREDEELRAMFVDEARLAGLLRHTNVVSVLDIGEDDDGPFLVMDYVEGLALGRLMRHHARKGETLPLQLALRIVAQSAAGLHAAHELRDSEGERLDLVHRDVSPQNILVGFDGAVRVTDFGIAKALGRSAQTDAGVLKGKLSYMAPEQLRFEGSDHRSDLFALGVVLFGLVSGEHPFGSDPESRARAVLQGRTPDLGEDCGECPPALVELVFELLAHDPRLRPEDARQVRQRLEDIIADLSALEGSLELGDYMQHVFREEREEQRAAIRRGRKSLERAPEDAEVTAVTVPATGAGAGTADAPSRRRRRALALSAGIAAVVAAAGAFAAWVGSSQRESTPAERTVTAEPEPTPDSSDEEPQRDENEVSVAEHERAREQQPPPPSASAAPPARNTSEPRDDEAEAAPRSPRRQPEPSPRSKERGATATEARRPSLMEW